MTKEFFMDFILFVLVLPVPVSIAILTGLLAKRLRRNRWPWFFIGLVLPLVGCIILLCLPEKPARKVPAPDRPAKRTVFDHEFSGN